MIKLSKNNHFMHILSKVKSVSNLPRNTTTYWDHMGTVIVVVIINIFLAVVRPALSVLVLALFSLFFFSNITLYL